MRRTLGMVRGAAATLSVVLPGRRRERGRRARVGVAYRPQPLQRWDP